MRSRLARVLNAGAWAVGVGGAAALVVVLSLRHPQLQPAASGSLGTSAPAHAEGTVPEDTASDKAVAAWARFRPAARFMVSAGDVRGLHGLMTLEEGPDNAVGSADSTAGPVQFVWCKDDGGREQDADATGGAPGPGAHFAEFEARVPEEGTYFPWARVWWEDSCGNSVIVALERDSEPARQFVVQDGTMKWWHWLPVAGEGGIKLQQGAYRLLVVNREDGARLSRLLFTTRSYATYKPETPEG